MMHYTVLRKRYWILGRSQKQRHSRREAVHTRHSLQHTQQIYSVCYWYICLTGTGDLSGRKIRLLWHKAYSFCQADFRGIVTSAWVGCCW